MKSMAGKAVGIRKSLKDVVRIMNVRIMNVRILTTSDLVHFHFPSYFYLLFWNLGLGLV